MPSATAPHYQLAVMCKHHARFRHTHTGDDRNKCFALSLKVIEQLFFLIIILLQRSMEISRNCTISQLSTLYQLLIPMDKMLLLWQFVFF